MLTIAIIIGIYSYAILFLGLFGQLNLSSVIAVTLLAAIIFILINKNFISHIKRINVKKLTKFEIFLIILIILMAIVNLAGALGPELAFDALWYHLAMPKLFVASHKIFFIQDNLFYYSLMPKLTEMLYTSSLILGSEITAKIIHFGFGILTCLAVYKISRLYLSRQLSLLAVTIFYSNLVVSWLSITAYSDLTRTFYETLSLLYFFYFVKKGQDKYLLISSILLGFAISAKLLSIGSISIFVILIFLMPTLKTIEKIKKSITYIVLSLLVPLPWFIISFYYTKNPFFPAFSNLAPKNFSFDFINPILFVRNSVETFLFSSDPISPVYLIFLLLIVINIKKIYKKNSELIIYSAISFLLWYFITYSNIWHGTDKSGGARFLTAYLPAYTVICVIAFSKITKKFIHKVSLFVIIFVALITILYRGMANSKYLPYIFGFESKQNFLIRNLNFSFGDFYDENNDIKKIVGENTVMLYGMHNLYYVDFNYTLNGWKDKQNFKYILIQNSSRQAKPAGATEVYKNAKTDVKLYKL